MNITSWVLLAAIALLIGWDIFAAVEWGYSETISADLLNAAKERPIVAAAIGVLIGHWFWPQ